MKSMVEEKAVKEKEMSMSLVSKGTAGMLQDLMNEVHNTVCLLYCS